ncbi:phage tail sheath protein [Paenibacillus albiflavus]|uniref:Phage tail sheath protein n=1 Tax=Paenibacillus albiflavus TaxID=2545760 RepID=A0A4R4E092_9BACL|nr:phage tail sheath family protein [Paenibacillus albiflavus]TCZ70970.1 phage tail sheath protein [Paenibacillus albiflavus]
MVGGNWSGAEMPVLPGMYMNFQSAATSAIQPGARGVVVVPVKSHWGPIGEFVEINSEVAAIEAYGSDSANGATAYTTLKFGLMGGARKLLAYRLADQHAAESTLALQDTSSGSAVSVLKLDAKYAGERGNQFNVTVQANLVDQGLMDLRLYDAGKLLRTFTFSTGSVQAIADAINNDPNNKWIVASKLADGNGTLAKVSNVPLSGGHSGIDSITNADYIAALAAFETQEFNLVALDGVSESSLLVSVASWVTRLRQEGKGVIAVLGGSLADDTAADAVSKASARSAIFNQEGVVNVGTGVQLGGVRYSSAQTAAYAAGLIAGQKLNESTTYAAAPFEDVTRRWTRSEQEHAVKQGVFLLVQDGRQVKVLRGVNSLVTLKQGQNQAWKKVRTIRVMDAINSDLQRTVEDSYIGKVNNTAEGRLALLSACKEYLRVLAQSGVIDSTSYDVMLDPHYYGEAAEQQPEPDQVFIQWNASLSDVMEQIFGTFNVQ